MLTLALLACRPDEGSPVADLPGTVADSGTSTVRDTHTTTPPDDSGDSGVDTGTSGPPILFVVYVDDQGFNTLWSMSTLQERLAPESVRFNRAYTNIPLCCPARSSLLSGGWYPRDTGVLTNDEPNGGAWLFQTSDTLATRLQAGGFATALIGKYLNKYEDGLAPEVPPGWDLFLAGEYDGNGYDNVVIRGSSTPDAATQGTFEDTGGEYLTYFLFDEALAFLDSHPDEPAFVLLSVMAPHIYATPADEDVGTWDDYTPRPASWNEADVTDKPAWLQRKTFDDEDAADADSDARRMMENLAAVDRSVGTLLDGLEARGVLDRTVLIYASDNGYLNGEHRLTQKGIAYEEAVHVPLMVRMPGVAARDDDRLVSVNLDLAATALDFAGLPATGEGISLLDAVADPDTTLRDHVFLDNYAGNHPVWAGVVTDRYKYVEWPTGETELYDLDADPDEMESLHASPPADADVASMAAWVDEHRAFSVTTTSLADGRVGQPYEAHLETWGGTAPFSFALTEGSLPPGVSFQMDGSILGTPEASGAYDFTVVATDSSVSAWTGRPQVWEQALTLTVGASATTEAVRDGATARFRVRAHPGALVSVLVSADDTLDGPERRSSPVRAGADGMADVTIDGLDPAHDAYWTIVVDGVRRPTGGRLRRPRPATR